MTIEERAEVVCRELRKKVGMSLGFGEWAEVEREVVQGFRAAVEEAAVLAEQMFAKPIVALRLSEDGEISETPPYFDPCIAAGKKIAEAIRKLEVK